MSGRTPKSVDKRASHPDAGKVEHNPSEKNKTCFNMPDFLFLLGWIVTVIIMLWVAFFYGVTKLEDAYHTYRVQVQEYEDHEGDLVDDMLNRSIVGCKHVIRIFSWCMLFAIMVSFVWCALMVCLGGYLINIVIFTGITFFVIFGFCSASMMGTYGMTAAGFSVSFFVLAILGLLFWCCMRSRITFASTSLAVATKFVAKDFMLFAVALLMVLLTGLWSLVFGLAEFGVYWHFQPSNEGSSAFFVYVLLLLTFFWTVQVFRNIVVVTVSGTGAEWWFSQGLMSPTLMAFLRAITYDLGPICFGSLLVALVQTLYSMLMYLADSARKQGGFFDCCMHCLACCVACLERCAEYMNKYAFTYVGIYGYGFMPAGRKVMSLFVHEGLTILKNDVIVEYVLLFGDLVVALCTCALGVILSIQNPDLVEGFAPYKHAVVGTVAFFIGFAIAGVMNGVIDSANKTVFVLFLENPHVLEVTHPEDHDRLASAWKMAPSGSSDGLA